jgi:release factor glutamine methyltransferase
MTKPGAAQQTAPVNTVEALVRELTSLLAAAGIEAPLVAARDIVAAVAGVDRFWPVLNRNSETGDVVRDQARVAALRRSRGEPFAYAVGRAAFRHLTLRVNTNVLIPRQETEQLVELVLPRLRRMPGGVVADVGTGSGAIALSLATELGDRRLESHSGDVGTRPFRIIATDVSRAALDVARENARAVLNDSAFPVEFRSGDMFSVIRETGLCAVVSNPPYIAFDEARSLPRSVRNWEPPEALYSGRQGMRAVERLAKGSGRALKAGGLLAIEVDSSRASLAAELLLSSGFFRDVSVEFDLVGRERFVLATKS